MRTRMQAQRNAGKQMKALPQPSPSPHHDKKNANTRILPCRNSGTGPIQPVSVVMSFRTRDALLKPRDKAGTLIDRLIGICISKPPYLRKQDAERHISLLHELKEFTAYNPDLQENGLVGDFAISHLPRALERWVISFFLKRNHPMLPVYALDTGRFLQFHSQGESPYPYTWELDPLVSPDEHGSPWRALPFDRSFRQEFSRRLGRLMVQGKVPTVATVNNDWNVVEEIRPGNTFRMIIQRCHLSEAWNHTGPVISCQEEPLQFDLMSEFRLPGEIILPRRDDSSKLIGVPADVPGCWITHAIEKDWNNPEGPERLIPVPHWSLGDISESSSTLQ